MNTLEGTYTALITPFSLSGDTVDYDAFQKIIQFQIKNNIEGVVPCGTTGESPTISFEEHKKIVEKVTEWTKQKSSSTVVVAGTGSNSTREAIELSRSAESSGADYVLSVNPYYNKPNQEGLIKHFSSIADSINIPVILYNIPSRTNVQVSIDSMDKLAEHPNIVGVKEATGDMNFIANIIYRTQDKNFTILSGDDNVILPILSIGGRGVISVASNIYPKAVGDISRMYLKGEIDKAKNTFLKMLDFFSILFVETNPMPVKYIASLKLLCHNTLRLPLLSLSVKNQEKIKKVISNLDE